VFLLSDKLFVNMKKCSFGLKKLDYLWFLCEPRWTKNWSIEVFNRCYLATMKDQPWPTIFQVNGELSQELYYIVSPWHASSQRLQAPRVWNYKITNLFLQLGWCILTKITVFMVTCEWCSSLNFDSCGWFDYDYK